MSFPHYQQANPGWGTPQYQFGPPPTPAFQSQPSWRGMDFYRAHATAPDPSLFDHAWNRVRGYSDPMEDGIGVGTHEARHWHRRAYGGIGELSRMQPEDIGHAAAYEAYRTWIHNSSIYEPLSGDSARQREGLIGLAVAEATRLLPYAGREMDHHARRVATEAAAETASVIYYESQSRDRNEGEYRSRSRSRFGTSSSYGSSYGDPYAYDDELAFPRHRSQSRPRSQSRHHSRSRSRSGHGAIPIVGGGYSPMPGTPYSASGYPSSVPPGIASSFPTGSYSSYGSAMPIHGTPYPTSAVSIPGVAPSYQGSSMPVVMHRNRASSMSYPQNPYMGAALSSNGMLMPGVPQQPTIVIQQKSRKHKHHRHHSRSRRSRSSDRY